ncbi:MULTISPECIES: helix-turn-helix domain-containing protein [Catenuloplanes]|uniref:Transcriptional regulator with XRE-family HTH domain n=1 Tax=Catenuloplanes niger TaxID=587534 RepID=A0AAE3ZQY8_9ACTN|nr:helix-turn-helix transcriptional regulator [Catenuloplanes niger]MDR7323971.1 transcriptional regulator with XRE-family HTH domain [Catenuloplanes niger]
MAPADLPRDIGGFIRDMRRNAKISLRQLAEQAGVSNPYLSQIERGLRKPSAEVLQQLAGALRVSTPAMYLRAGLLEGDAPGVLEAIAGDPDLTMAQKQSLTQIYDTFRRENAREAAAAAAAAAETAAAEAATAAAAASATAATASDTAGAAAAGASAAAAGVRTDGTEKAATDGDAAEQAPPVTKAPTTTTPTTEETP